MKNSQRSSQLPISVLNLPPLTSFVEASSSTLQYSLHHVIGKRNCIEVYNISVPKSRLFSNLQIYQWRNHTQFPISKTKYVSIGETKPQSSNMIYLTVYNEHCPVKLNRIYEMSLPQTLYMLKQSIIGFERLFNRFGPFQIKENMIAINQKGFCKVWVNQNFGLNSFHKVNIREQNMVWQIQEIMENHSAQTKNTRKLFRKLKQCTTFLSILRQVEIFAINSHTLVSNRFVLMCQSKETPKSQYLSQLQKKQSVSGANIRYSIVSSSNRKRHTENVQKQQKLDADNSQQKNNSFSNQIKRFKSLQRIKAANLMKVSDGQTFYTHNMKDKQSNIIGYPRQETAEKVNTKQKGKNSKWIQKGSFLMDEDIEKQRKQLSYSTHPIKSQKILKNKNRFDRKFSTSITHNKDNYKFNINKVTKKSHHDCYVNQFGVGLDPYKQERSFSPNQIDEEDDDDNKQREEHTDKIIKNNGWDYVPKFLQHQQQLNQSFHEGEQVQIVRDQKLEMLDTIRKRQVATSIMPGDEYLF